MADKPNWHFSFVDDQSMITQMLKQNLTSVQPWKYLPFSAMPVLAKLYTDTDHETQKSLCGIFQPK